MLKLLFPQFSHNIIMTDYLSLHNQGKLLFLVSHYTEKVFNFLTPLKIIDKYQVLTEFYNNLKEIHLQQIVPSSSYSNLVNNLISNAKTNPIIYKLIEMIIVNCENK